MPDGRPAELAGQLFQGDRGRLRRDRPAVAAHQEPGGPNRERPFAIKKDLVHFTPQMITLLGTEILAMGNRALRALEPDVVASHGGSGARTPAPAES
jgi:hypothetical protein